MAGPEDSTTSSHHHGNPADTGSDLRLQTTEEEEEDALLNEKNNNPLATDPSTSHAAEGHHATDTATRKLEPGELLRIDLREGKDTKQSHVQSRPSPDPKTSLPCYPDLSEVSHRHTSSQTSCSESSQSSDPKTSQSVCQDDETSNVFDVSSHHLHLFFIEDDGDDDAVEEEEEDLEDNAFEDSDREREEEEDDLDNDCFSWSAEDDSDKGRIPGHSPSHQGVPRSAPWTIPSTSSSLTTVCRQSHGSQVVVRCQIQSPGSSAMRKTSSCPSAFSPLWTQVMPVERRGSESTLHAEGVEQPVGE